MFIQDSRIAMHTCTCTSMHTTHTITHTSTHVVHVSHTYIRITKLPLYKSKLCTVANVHTHTCSPTARHHQHSVHLHSVHLCMLLPVYCIDHVPPNPQDGRSPLMLAAEEGHLPVARLLVETYHCGVNEEDGEVSGWELMGGVSEHSACVSSHM